MSPVTDPDANLAVATVMFLFAPMRRRSDHQMAGTTVVGAMMSARCPTNSATVSKSMVRLAC